ncbi:DoxX family protein [Pseudonocardia hispaniensis]|uniref:DoxX family protein n=1 Tax=Pseudonocardia hispaniensis TaxID=904933 RepID=A0ABW1J856_9PSEU
MLASIFISAGINALRAPEGHVTAAKPVLDAASPAIDKIVEIAPIEQRPADETLIKTEAAIKIAAGSLLALGVVPRLSSAVLAGTLIPTTLAGHRFWEIEDPAERQAQRTQFIKNVSLFGGLLIAAADTAGRPSLAWRGRRAARLAAATAATQAGTVTGLAHELSGRAHEATERAGEVSREASREMRRRRQHLQRLVEKRGAEWRKALEERATHWHTEAGHRAGAFRKEADKRQAALAAWETQVRKALAEARRRTPGYAEQLTALAAEAATQAAKLRSDLAVRAHDLGVVAEGAAHDVRKRIAAVH